MRNVEEAGAWLESLIDLEKRSNWRGIRVGLAPIRALLERLGNPHAGLACIHVAGSKGKGSTVLLAEAILTAGGVSAGTFTSPHLERWTERVRIGGAEIEDEALVSAVAAVRPHVEVLRAQRPDDAPTFFDATTAAALVAFREAQVGCCLLEVGLGGRLDSTNVVLPRVACITSIELEHTDKLGETLAAIAGEKAGILKPGVPAVAGALPSEAAATVRARAAELGVELAWADRDFGCEPLGGDGTPRRVRLWDGDFACETQLGVRGDHQRANAALAVAAVGRSGVLAPERRAEAVRRGLAEARLPGRCEVLATGPLLLVDAAHTGASARALARELASLAPAGAHLVLSCSADKDTGALLDALLPRASALTLTRALAQRSLAPEVLAREVRARAPQLAVRVEADPERALRGVRDALVPNAAACAAGSVYLAGIARRIWGGGCDRVGG